MQLISKISGVLGEKEGREVTGRERGTGLEKKALKDCREINVFIG